jgi:hypothetical protein
MVELIFINIVNGIDFFHETVKINQARYRSLLESKICNAIKKKTLSVSQEGLNCVNVDPERLTKLISPDQNGKSLAGNFVSLFITFRKHEQAPVCYIS